MSATVLYMSMSLDGFIAGPNERPDNGLGDRGERLHAWSWSEGLNAEVLEEFLGTGAVVAGRGTAEPTDFWGGDHHNGVPIFLLSRHRPKTSGDGGRRLTYVSDVRTAMSEARQAAGERNVLVHGAGVAQVALAAGVLDELELHVVPVLLGQGGACSTISVPNTSSSSGRACSMGPASRTCTTACGDEWRPRLSTAAVAALSAARPIRALKRRDSASGSASLLALRPSPAAQPTWHRHRLKSRVDEHVVRGSQVLATGPLLRVDQLLPSRLSRLRRFLRRRCGCRTLLPEPHRRCPFLGDGMVRPYLLRATRARRCARPRRAGLLRADGPDLEPDDPRARGSAPLAHLHAVLSTAISRGAERLAYEKLLPLGFHVFQLAENVQNVNDHSHPRDPRQYICGGTYYPWYYYYASPLAWTSLLQGYDPVSHNNSYEHFVLSVPPGANTYHGTPPDVATLTRMFGPVAKSNEVSDGGPDISPLNMLRSATHDGWTGNGPGGDSCVFLG